MFSRIDGSALLCLAFITNSVFAEDQAEFDDERYEVCYGDVHNDGHATDIYFRGLKRLIIIHGEITIPIFAAPRDSYARIKTGSGYLQRSNL